MYLTRTVGREDEVVRVLELLGRERLVTLTGPGGIGKTRLAAEVEVRAGDAFEAGVVWVTAGTPPGDDLVAGRIAHALGLSEAGPERLPEIVARVLDGRSLLLVLDDCDPAVDAVARAARALLGASPGLTVLVTSREALDLPGERIVPVPPLGLPPEAPATVEELVGDAAALFLERARDALPTLELDDDQAAAVARICRRLDGIPLAIELAAARVRVLTPAQIAGRLDDAFDLLTGAHRGHLPRHRTLRATNEWSDRLLPEPERLLLHRLSVFRGPCTLESVEAVCADDRIPARKILERLSALVDRSLLWARPSEGSVRYSLPGTVRLYAAGELAGQGDAVERAVRERHARHFLERAEDAAPRLERLEPAPELLDRFAVEHDDLRAALEWSLAHEPGVALRLAAAVAWWWITSGRWREGQRWLDAVLGQEAGGDDPAVRARALVGAGSLAYLLHDPAGAVRHYGTAVEILRTTGEASERARALALLAQARADAGEGEGGLTAVDEAVEIARSTDDAWVLPWVLACRGAVHRSLARFEEAEVAYAEAEAAARAGEAPSFWLFEAPLGRALAATHDGDERRAAVHALAAVRVARRVGRSWHGSRALLTAAAVAHRLGRADAAARLLGSLGGLREDETPLLPHEARLREELTLATRESLGPAAFGDAHDDGAALGPERALDLAERELSELTVLPAGASPAGKRNGSGRREPNGGAAGSARALDGTHDLRVRALGPLEIDRRGAPLSPESWPYARPRELLLYLLCRPRGATRDEAAEALWPDASPDRAKNSFHVALHRLRRVLGGPGRVVLDGERYRVDPEWSVFLDADRFEEEARSALRALREGGDEPDALERLRSAIALYRGEFLESEKAAGWHLERRDRLRRIFVAGQSAVARALLREGRVEEAAEGFERVHRADELNEEACRALMTCRARLGDRAGALHLFRRLESLLRRELGTEPEPGTVELADRLRHNLPV